MNPEDIEEFIETGRKKLLKKLDSILKKDGFDVEYVNTRSFWELEEDMHIGHYQIYPSNWRRAEDNIEWLLKL